MEIYTLRDWMAFFYLYCFLGWCWESGYVSVKKKRWVNRGFIHGPFLPLYGFGAITVLMVGMPLQGKPVALYFVSAVAATVLEYVTGVTMEALFKVRYWDYSHVRFNFQGQICLMSTIAWGAFGLIMVELVQPRVQQLEMMIDPAILGVGVSVITVFIVSDFAISFRTAIDMRDMMAKVQEFREEVARMQKRADVLAAVIADEMEQNERVEQARAEIAQLKEWIENGKQTMRQRFSMDKFQMMRRNPTAISVKYKDLYEELKQKTKTEVWKHTKKKAD